MTLSRTWIGAATLGLLLTATVARAGAGDKPVAASLVKLTPDQIAQRIDVRDDPLERQVMFSTQPVHRKGGFTNGVTVNDGFIQATKSRDGGAVTWRVRYDFTYFGAHPDVTQVDMRTRDGVVRIKPTAVRRWSEECPESIGTCGQQMSVEFEAPEDVMRDIAAAYRPGDRTPWRLRFGDDHGDGVTVGLAPVEVAGLVGVVDSWKP